MCGICGFTGEAPAKLLPRMVRSLGRRGPDGAGQWSQAGIHFGHTRLAIIDIEGGAQPMTRGGVTVTFNGEIYNYEELRRDIEARGFSFSTYCDTEILPLGFAAFGEDFFARLNGMFAFALHDAQSGRVYLVRDHFGIKPLYYARSGRDLIFASSMRTVALHQGVSRSLRTDEAVEFLQFRYVRSGRPLFAGVEALPPGHMAVRGAGGDFQIRPFWVPGVRRPRPDLAVNQVVGAVCDAIEDSVRRQLRADTPIGIFLSGGVDSAVVANFATSHAERPLTAFTFAVGGRADESDIAADLARRYGFAHRLVRLDMPNGFLDFPGIVAAMDNPYGDAIVLPTYRLCEAAVREVKVVLTGEGADEMFGGYVHLPVLRKLDRLARYAPWVRHLAPLVRLLPIPLLDHFFDYQASLGRLGRQTVSRLVGSVGDSGRSAMLTGSVLADEDVTAATTLPPPPARDPADLSLGALMHGIVGSWLPNQILSKMDELSMAVGLEARVPFVDVHLYDLLNEAADALFMGQGAENKAILRAVARREEVPVADRRKVAFHLPVEEVCRDQLLALGREWLSPAALLRHGVLRPAFAAETMAAVARGEFLAAKRLVTMISMQAWLDNQGGSNA